MLSHHICTPLSRVGRRPCTGWRAKAALAHAFAAGNYGPSVVGSLYALRATWAGRLRREPPPDRWGLTRTLKTMLFEVTTTDLSTYALVSVLLAGAALLATYVPVRRAARIDPLTALRCE